MISQPDPESIVVPCDFSQNFPVALQKARQLAGPETRIHVLHVAPVAGPDNGILYDLHEKRTRIRLQKRIAECCRDIDGQGHLQFDVAFGLPRREIVRFAERCNADLMVMTGPRGTGRINRWFGDLAGRVSRSAGIPVIAVNNATHQPRREATA